LGYERSSGIYHQDAENYPELGMIARFAIYEPGTMDYYAKTLPGFGVARNSDTGAILTSSEQAALVSRNVNSIVNEGGQAVFKMGYSFSGNQLLEIVFRDFYAARLTEAFQNWRINKKRIPYNQKGIDSAESVFLGVTERYKS